MSLYPMSLYPMLTAVLLLSGVVLAVMTAAYYAPANVERRIRERRDRPMSRAKYARVTISNALFSWVLVYALTWALYPVLFEEGEASVLRVVLEGFAMLVLYDVFYYLVHRYPFHEWSVLRRVHAVHHAIKNPTAFDSLYLHPVETFLGLALLWVCALLVTLVAGKVSVYSFAWAFCVYSLLNITIHSGLKLNFFPFGTLTHLTERHYKHHAHMKAKNYSSVSPTVDLVLGTEEV